MSIPKRLAASLIDGAKDRGCKDVIMTKYRLSYRVIYYFSVENDAWIAAITMPQPCAIVASFGNGTPGRSNAPLIAVRADVRNADIWIGDHVSCTLA